MITGRPLCGRIARTRCRTTFCLPHPHPVCQEAIQGACPPNPHPSCKVRRWVSSLLTDAAPPQPPLTGLLICTSNPVSRPLSVSNPNLQHQFDPNMVPHLHTINKHPWRWIFHARWTRLTPWVKPFCLAHVSSLSASEKRVCMLGAMQ